MCIGRSEYFRDIGVSHNSQVNLDKRPNLNFGEIFIEVQYNFTNNFDKDVFKNKP